MFGSHARGEAYERSDLDFLASVSSVEDAIEGAVKRAQALVARAQQEL